MQQKIIYVITKGNFGGAQRYVFDLATGLSQDAFEAVVAMGQGNALEEKLEEVGIRTIRLSKLTETRRAGPQMSDAGSFFDLLALFRDERPDVVHLNSSRAAFFGSIAARIAGVRKIIFTAHGWPFKEPRPRIVQAFIWLASYLTAFLSHKTIVLSEGDLALGKRMPGIAPKLSLIYNGVERGAHTFKNEMRTKLGLPQDALIIGTVAELNRNKGIPTLIEALTSLPKNVQLCLIGEGEDRKKLETLAVLRGVRDRILFAGGLPHAESYIPAFDIFTLPSRKEGLPYTILEAGMQAIPVVASDISGIRDIVHSPEVGILVPPGDARALAQALVWFIEHPREQREMGLALQHRTEQAFSLSEMRRKTEHLYER